MAEEVFPWLKSLPLAPEYHPTIAEFQDPISYIFKIEKEASKYGICKIIPPVSASPKKTAIDNLKRSLSSQSPDLTPTFATRTQQMGFCPRRHIRPVKKSVWESAEYYSLSQFEAKAKNSEKNYMKKVSNPKRVLNALEMETLYWKAQMDKPFLIEYANDMPGSAFDQTVGGHGGGLKQGKKEIGDVMTVGESQWNMNEVSRAKGSLLRFMKEEIPGVTSPMVYISMLFSWFAWHVEDHELHSLNYMHMGASKTWYGVPKDAAVAFEDVVRVQGYNNEISPIVTCATLAKKNTIMSPEVLLKAGVPCCRLVQNAGEFVVTFPRAYHFGFSHGHNCAEAVNIATPGWLIVAREAAIRRVSINCAPMVSHSQLLYDLALSLSASEPKPEPRSSRLKGKLKGGGEALVKRLFLEDIMQNNALLHLLGKGSPIAVLSKKDLVGWIPSDSCYRTRLDSSLSIQNDESLSITRRTSSIGSFDPASVFSCVTCGNLCYSSVAIVQPSMAAARYLMSNDLDLAAAATDYTHVVDLVSSSGDDGLFDVPIKSENESSDATSVTRPEEIDSALKLLALAYGDSSDSEEEDDSLIISRYQIESPYHVNTKPSSLKKNTPRDEDSWRFHVFCLEHAREVEQRLRTVGGAHILLLCHQDYPTIDEEARSMAEELGIWTDLGYRDTNENDKVRIRLALENDESAHGIQDWVVKLGFDIFYSARLGQSPIYTKQMPYNSVIYNAIGHTESTNSKSSGKQRQKKIVVAGKWCGKVWMTNQVHPLLVVKDLEEHDSDLKPKNKTETETQSENSKKRKMVIRVSSSSPSPSPSPSPALLNGGARRTNIRKNQIRKGTTTTTTTTVPNLNKKPRGTESESDSDEEYWPAKGIKRRRSTRAKKAKKVVVVDIEEEEGEFRCDIEGCNMSFASKHDVMVHKRNVCPVRGCGKIFFSHKYLVQQHSRVHMDIRPLKCKWVGCSKSFKWAWALTEHYRVHTGARPYQCMDWRKDVKRHFGLCRILVVTSARPGMGISIRSRINSKKDN